MPAQLSRILIATQYHTLWFLGTWLQATGSLLSVTFFLALVQRSGAAERLAGMLAFACGIIIDTMTIVEIG